MKTLTLALLLSIAPAALTAHENEVRSHEITVEETNKCGCECGKIEQAQDERCCGLAELVLIDITEAYDATSAFVTLSGYNATTNQTMSAEGWEFLSDLMTINFGNNLVTQTENSVSFVFERGDMDVVQWFATLAEIEAKIVALQSVIENNPHCVGGTLTFGVNK